MGCEECPGLLWASTDLWELQVVMARSGRVRAHVTSSKNRSGVPPSLFGSGLSHKNPTSLSFECGDQGWGYCRRSG